MSAFRRTSKLACLSIVALASATSLSACGSGAAPGDEPGSEQEETGTLELAVTLGGVTLNSFSYAITRGSYSKTGSVDVSNSNTVSAVIGGIPAGAGYTIALSGTDASDPALTCSASAPFDVTAGATTDVTVKLRCRLPDKTGTVRVNGTLNICPRIDGLSVSPAETSVGHTISLASEVTDTDSAPAPLVYAFTATGGTLAGAATPNATFTCTAAGNFDVTLTVSDGDCTDSVTTPVTCSPGTAPPPAPLVKVNEVESNGGTPGDWTELYNAGPTPASIGGWVFKDNDDTHAYAIPAGTVIAPGGYYIIEEAAQTFGLGGADSVRLFDASGVIVDSYSWTAHATTTYARCPNGTGAFATSLTSTKGLANDCVPTGPVTFAWPGLDDVATVDEAAQFTSNLSGLTYEAATASSPAVLWAVVNGPGTLFRMVKTGATWLPDAGEWALGKALHYPNGVGNPDSEGVTYGSSVADGIYVATERNNDASTVSRNAVLRFDVSAAGTQLTATHDWDVTSLLPATGANLGLEGITWVPDAFLVSKGFFDESKSLPYNPTDYPGHGTGVFIVGVEGTGMLHVFAMNHTSGAATKLASFTSGNPGAMGLEFDREVGYLWATCDDTCGNKASVLGIDTTAGSPTLGRFVVRRQFNRPTTLPDTNNEGIAIASESECAAGVKPFFWSDDNDLGTHSLRQGYVTCGPFLP